MNLSLNSIYISLIISHWLLFLILAYSFTPNLFTSFYANTCLHECSHTCVRAFLYIRKSKRWMKCFLGSDISKYNSGRQPSIKLDNNIIYVLKSIAYQKKKVLESIDLHVLKIYHQSSAQSHWFHSQDILFLKKKTANVSNMQFP